MAFIILAFVALIPPLYLMYYIYQKDKVEKEPVGLVAKTFFFGVLSTFPAIVAELILGAIIMLIFPGYSTAYYIVDAMIGTALVEEFVKMKAMKLSVWKNPNFNYTFDAVVYSVAAALGFAAFENVGYVFANGLGTGIMRALTAIPGHCTFGILMGMFLGFAKLEEVRGNRKVSRRFMMKALVVPTLVHGIYDGMLFIHEVWSILFFFAFIIVVDIIMIIKIKSLEAHDTPIFGGWESLGMQQTYVHEAPKMRGSKDKYTNTYSSTDANAFTIRDARLDELEKKYNDNPFDVK